ncbi:hypothetical protein RM572_21905 [Streptomyces sp. DSM 42041]|uniref:Uncharacterized protein n=1 Tax=Streptomyces hazeniae TaxID=3075538 RepID=A0ABU2NWP7_9ACTN|nr:hypothetical protein [Streptomyces sp. DSM 42041]MDT0381417.1 hypothetical protein [Streptomyces sp. DSM 42041]
MADVTASEVHDAQMSTAKALYEAIEERLKDVVKVSNAGGKAQHVAELAAAYAAVAHGPRR